MQCDYPSCAPATTVDGISSNCEPHCHLHYSSCLCQVTAVRIVTVTVQCTNKSGDWQRREVHGSGYILQNTAIALDFPSVAAGTGAIKAPHWVIRAALSVLEHWPHNIEPYYSWTNAAIHTARDTGYHQDLKDPSTAQPHTHITR